MAAEIKDSKGKKDSAEEKLEKLRVIKGKANVLVGGKQTAKEKWFGGKKVSEAKFDLKYFELTYDSFGESLEPVYYWLLDFLREQLDYDVKKTADFFAAAEASGWLGEMGARRTALEKRASELLGTINMVVKSIINLVYDLREFDLRFKSYDDLKSKDAELQKSAEQSLKTIWLTEVDMKKGAAAINALVQNLNFISLRDAFMAAEIKWGKDRAETKQKTLEAAATIEVPDIVKRPLRGRIAEFVEWIYLSETELRKRYSIEKAYLKSQDAALKTYTKWARPYLIATQKLMPREIETMAKESGEFGLSPAEIPSGFDVMQTYLEIFGKNEVKKYGHLPEIKVLKDEDKVYSCIEIKIGYRVNPGVVGERGHYSAKGKVIVRFIPYVMSGKDLKELDEMQESEVLQFIDTLTKDTLDAMGSEIEEYTGEKKEEEKEEKKELQIPILKTIKKMNADINKHMKEFKEAFKSLGIKMPPKKQSWEVMLLKAAAAKKAEKETFLIYEMYKKSHGMLTW